MSFQEKSLQCSDCGTTFAFTIEEQEFFSSKGFANEPKRCPSCRQSRKERQNSNGNQRSYSNFQSQRQMYPATCSRCGKTTEVPFQPKNDRPVYCRDCYTIARATR